MLCLGRIQRQVGHRVLWNVVQAYRHLEALLNYHKVRLYRVAKLRSTYFGEQGPAPLEGSESVGPFSFLDASESYSCYRQNPMTASTSETKPKSQVRHFDQQARHLLTPAVSLMKSSEKFTRTWPPAISGSTITNER